MKDIKMENVKHVKYRATGGTHCRRKFSILDKFHSLKCIKLYLTNFQKRN